MEFFSTFGGNPVACAAGLAVLDVLEQDALQAHARRVGEHLLGALRDLQDRRPLIGDVRGSGLFLGVELVRDRVTLEPATDEASYVVDRLRARRARRHGRSVRQRPEAVPAADLLGDGRESLRAAARRGPRRGRRFRVALTRFRLSLAETPARAYESEAGGSDGVAEKTDKTKAVVRSILDQHTDAMLTCDAVQHESRALMDELSRQLQEKKPLGEGLDQVGIVQQQNMECVDSVRSFVRAKLEPTGSSPELQQEVWTTWLSDVRKKAESATEGSTLTLQASRGPTLCRAAFASRPVTIIEGGPLPQGTAAVYKRVATRAEIWVPEHVAQFASAMPGAPSALVLCVREEMQRTGQEYGRGIPAYRRAWEVRAVRAADGLIQALGDFSTPPRSRSGRENSAPGRRPTQRSSSGWKHNSSPRSRRGRCGGACSWNRRVAGPPGSGEVSRPMAAGSPTPPTMGSPTCSMRTGRPFTRSRVRSTARCPSRSRRTGNGWLRAPKAACRSSTWPPLRSRGGSPSRGVPRPSPSLQTAHVWSWARHTSTRTSTSASGARPTDRC